MQSKVSDLTTNPQTLIIYQTPELKSNPKTLKMVPQRQPDTFIKTEHETEKQNNTFFQKISEKIKPYKDKIAMGLALLGGIIIGLGSSKSKQKQLEHQIRDLTQDKEVLKQELNSLVTPENFDEKVNIMKNEIEKRQIDYNPAISPLGDKEDIEPDKSDYIDLPEEHVKTSNRSNIEPFSPPKFMRGRDYFVHIPDSEEAVITHQSSSFKETTMKTTITEDYADSVQWDSKKIARDLMQNFYDGHNQTLNGVDIEFKKQENGKYKVRITGKSTYSPDKAVLLGESSKRDNSKAAGNYGEGLKMVVLKLLKDGKSDSVKIASGDWRVDWKLDKGDLNEKKVLAYTLQESEHFDGNYIEFETDDNILLTSIVDSVNNFYYSGNSNFANPDFENEQFGLKILPDGEKGRIYIAGQEFEYNGNFNNINGITLFIKEKPPANYNGYIIFDSSRDRISLSNDNIEAIASWLAQDTRNTKDDLAKILKALEPQWEKENDYFTKPHAKDAFLTGIIKGANDRNLKFNFPENCTANSYLASDGIKSMYSNAGYRICNRDFYKIGMKSINELVKNDRKHIPIEPNEKELNKIKILREAISILSPVIKDIGFNDDELNPNIYIFKNNDIDKIYSNVEGEAIVQYGISKGFWIDRNQLNTKDFAGLLTTTLHEITHKFGSDESALFSYKLTDVMEGVIRGTKDDQNIAMQLKILEEVWNKI